VKYCVTFIKEIAMSRIGKKPISIPAGVTVTVTGAEVTVKGPKGQLSQVIDSEFIIEQENGELTVVRPTEQKRHKAMHGLYRSLISNMVVGVSEGYKKELELVGVGYKASAQGNVLEFSLGYSHSIFLAVPSEISVAAETAKGKNPIVTLLGSDKQLIGQVAAKIRSLRKVEPYKGKGVRFVGEIVRRKAGKTAAK
jgi:large subunit ribosomal protein L6